MPITRRRLLNASGAGLAGGAAVAVLAACGSEREEPSTERDVELLETGLDGEAAVFRLYTEAAEQSLEPDARDAVVEFGDAAKARTDELVDAIRGIGGEAGEANANSPGAENPLEAIKLALTGAIGDWHAAVGFLSTPELRRLAFELISADAAELAAIRGLLGEDQTPEAFVTGGEVPPLTGTPEKAAS